MDPLFAAVELDAIKISAALGNAAGALAVTETTPNPPGAGPEAVLAQISSTVDSLSARAGRRPTALGVAAPSLGSGAAFLERSLRMPVRLANAAQCATLAELLQGHGRQYPTFVLFALGGSIGGGIVIDGRLRAAAGEIGHQTILPNGPLCACGNAGCLDALASGPAIARAAGYPDVETAAIAARNGDDGARRAFRDAANYLGIAAANLVTSLHPDAVLFSGAMSQLVDLLLVPVRAALNERVRMFSAQGVAVRRAAAGPHAVLLGALALNAAPDKLAL